MQLSDMCGRVSARLNEGATGPVYYPVAEIIARLNEANRFFVLLTLGLETTGAWTIPAATACHHMLSYFADWIVPLRLALVSGAKVRPATIEELTGINPGWLSTPGTPTRYASEGCDFIAIDQQPAGPLVVNVTYARSPLALISDADVPEVPTEYHPRLVDYAVYGMRQGEGGQEFEKSLRYFDSFLDGAQHYGEYVRSRNLGSRYDAVPFELSKLDRGTLLRTGTGG